MRSNGRRKSSSGPGKSNKSKHPWLVFCFFGVSESFSITCIFDLFSVLWGVLNGLGSRAGTPLAF